jgi:manganese transport protein
MALQLGTSHSKLILIHILESTNAVVYGEDAFDLEREEDAQSLMKYQKELMNNSINAEVHLGYGNPKTAIPELLIKLNCDMLVMGTHGHRTFKDLLLGTTVETVRHEIKIPLVLV